jgi:hypothetical protein
MDRKEEQALINAIALRVGTARQLSERYAIPVQELRVFAAANMERIVRAKERLEGYEEDTPGTGQALSPQQLDDLWITKKFERLSRLQAVAEEAQAMISDGNISAAEMTMAVREFRSYLMLAANELGQLLHRGSGDSGNGDVLSVEIGGVDMDSLR